MTVLSSIKSTIRNFISPKAMVLMYHQVCDRTSDPWHLAVSAENFDQQLDYIKRHFNVIPLDELVNALRFKKLQHKMMSITFDDATVDNYFNARPRLKANQIPATFYSTTYAPENEQSFWWEDLEQIILHSEVLPLKLLINIGENAVSFDFKKDAVLTVSLKNQIRVWRAEMPVPNERVELFILLWKQLQPLSFSLQFSTIRELMSWAGLVGKMKVQSEVMTISQLYDLSRDSLFSVGGHTVHHAMLGAQQAEVQSFEIHESKRKLETWLNREVTGFAYPYGNYNSTTRMLLRDAGFNYAVSTAGAVVSESDDLFELPRIQVKNWNGKEFESQLQKMLV